MHDAPATHPEYYAPPIHHAMHHACPDVQMQAHHQASPARDQPTAEMRVAAVWDAMATGFRAIKNKVDALQNQLEFVGTRTQEMWEVWPGERVEAQAEQLAKMEAVVAEQGRRVEGTARLAEGQGGVLANFMEKVAEEFNVQGARGREAVCRAHEGLGPRVVAVEVPQRQVEERVYAMEPRVMGATAKAEEALMAVQTEHRRRELEVEALTDMVRATRERVEALAPGTQGGLATLLTRGLQPAGQGQPTMDPELPLELARVKAELAATSEQLQEHVIRTQKEVTPAQVQFLQKLVERMAVEVETKAKKFLEVETVRLRHDTWQVVEEMAQRSDKAARATMDR